MKVFELEKQLELVTLEVVQSKYITKTFCNNVGGQKKNSRKTSKLKARKRDLSRHTVNEKGVYPFH